VKYFYFVAFAAVFPTAVVAQSAPDQSGLAIVKKEWKATRVVPPNSVLLEDPFDAIEESNRLFKQPSAVPRTKEKTDQSVSLSPETTEPPKRAEKTLKSTMSYSYELRVRNHNDKTIRYVSWDYVFLDPETKQEIGRHRINSKTNIQPGGVQTMKSKLVSPPTGAVDARTAVKKGSDLYIEQIVIRSVEFVDGSVWRPTSP